MKTRFTIAAVSLFTLALAACAQVTGGATSGASLDNGPGPDRQVSVGGGR